MTEPTKTITLALTMDDTAGLREALADQDYRPYLLSFITPWASTVHFAATSIEDDGAEAREIARIAQVLRDEGRPAYGLGYWLSMATSLYRAGVRFHDAEGKTDG